MATEKKFKATIEIGGAVAGSLKSSFAAVTGNTKILGASMSKLKSRMKEVGAAMKESGADTVTLGKELAALQRKADATRKVMDSWGRIQPIGDKFRAVGRNLAYVGVGATAAAAGLGAIFKTQFLDVAAQFEKFQTILETIEGSSEKAKASFQWISDFAAKTPYDLASVTEAFVKLKAYGIDPIKSGLLKTLGDTSAAMGKDVMDAVEAIADAVTGENERLKEFGIKATKEKGRILYRFTNKSGKEIVAAADANNRKQIQGTLQAIWNEKYGGAMEKMSGTWQGMMSNLGDQWTRFTALVMQSSAFENLKGRLGSLLATIDKMAADGSLQKIANEMGTAISRAIDSVANFAEKVPGWTKSFLQFMEPFGGLKTVFIGIAAVPLLPTIAAIASLGASCIISIPGIISLTTGLWGMAAAAAGGSAALLPIIGTAAVVAAGVVALGFAVKHVADNWDTYAWAINEAWTATKEFFGFLGTGLSNFGAATKEFASSFYSVVVGAFDGTNGAVAAFFGFLGKGLSNFGTAFGQFGLTIYNGIIGAFGRALEATNGFVASMGSAIGGWVTSTMTSIADLGVSIYDSIAGAFDRLTGKIGAWFSWVREKFANLGSSIKGVFTGGDSPTPVDGARAAGGPVSAGKNYLVGERGPEIFAPSSSGSIIPNHRTGGSVSNDNRTINITINASPGMNERTLADLVLARLDGRQAALAGGALYD